ncbi:maleylpyruvate isomerase family mycothiol-dependent enzyme [Micromonospora sp. NPDC049679]|uniref:maleylpyruvate isomerase family mycothiol-dependent enzyme n=1 Tax=Micromonospora sp. NPDC049679 TaxID=3155920 RepID=UPI0033F4668A
MDWRRVGPAIDVRPLFPLERGALLALLAGLDAAAWDRPTVCPGWTVHDLVAHLAHDYVRRLSGTRDRHASAGLASGEDLPTFLARVNDDFVTATRGLSTRVLIDLLAHLGPQLDALWSGLDLDGIGEDSVWWASPNVPAPVWLDVAREYTEFWVHQQQIRDALGRPGADQPELQGPVIDTFLRALPHTLREHPAPAGTALTVHVYGEAGGAWTVTRDPDGWSLRHGSTARINRIGIGPDTLWRLATRGITPEAARAVVTVEGDEALAGAALRILSIIR